MTDREYKQQKARIRVLIDKWTKPLGLRWWRIEYVYCREKRDESESSAYRPPQVGNNWMTAFATIADPYYLSATITAYFPTLIDLSDEDLEEYFIHELMHVLLSPMHHKSTQKEEEQVATRLAQSFMWTKEGR